jgi:hypothetical protein
MQRCILIVVVIVAVAVVIIIIRLLIIVYYTYILQTKYKQNFYLSELFSKIKLNKGNINGYVLYILGARVA